jgi:hypothetical protein
MQRVLRCNSTRNASFIVKAVRRGHPQPARLERWCTVPTEEALAAVSKSALNTGKHMLLAHTVHCRAFIDSAPHTVSQCHALLADEGTRNEYAEVDVRLIGTLRISISRLYTFTVEVIERDRSTWAATAQIAEVGSSPPFTKLKQQGVP